MTLSLGFGKAATSSSIAETRKGAVGEQQTSLQLKRLEPPQYMVLKYICGAQVLLSMREWFCTHQSHSMSTVERKDGVSSNREDRRTVVET